jgi:hypothetical protein
MFKVMESINELKEAVNKVIEITDKVIDVANSEIWNKAPLIVHQRFCAELVRIMKDNPDKTPKDVPEAMQVIDAFSVLEKCYPNIKEINANL